MKSTIIKAAGLALLLAGMGSILSATSVPEIDATSAGNALALLGGVVLVMRARKR
jgi:hypothetical protein